MLLFLFFALHCHLSTTLCSLPPNPYQWDIEDTSIRLIFGRYSGIVDMNSMIKILFRAQTEMVTGLVANKGDGMIPTPNLSWRLGILYLTVNQKLELPWSVLSRALVGLNDFYDTFYPLQCTVSILDMKE